MTLAAVTDPFAAHHHLLAKLGVPVEGGVTHGVVVVTTDAFVAARSVATRVLGQVMMVARNARRVAMPMMGDDARRYMMMMVMVNDRHRRGLMMMMVDSGERGLAAEGQGDRGDGGEERFAGRVLHRLGSFT